MGMEYAEFSKVLTGFGFVCGRLAPPTHKLLYLPQSAIALALRSSIALALLNNIDKLVAVGQNFNPAYSFKLTHNPFIMRNCIDFVNFGL